MVFFISMILTAIYCLLKKDNDLISLKNQKLEDKEKWKNEGFGDNEGIEGNSRDDYGVSNFGSILNEIENESYYKVDMGSIGQKRTSFYSDIGESRSKKGSFLNDSFVKQLTID